MNQKFLSITELSLLVKNKPTEQRGPDGSRPYSAPSLKVLSAALRFSRAFICEDDGRPISIPAVLMLKWAKAAGANGFSWDAERNGFIGTGPQSTKSRVFFAAKRDAVPAPVWDAANSDGKQVCNYHSCRDSVEMKFMPLSSAPNLVAISV